MPHHVPHTFLRHLTAAVVFAMTTIALPARAQVITPPVALSEPAGEWPDRPAATDVLVPVVLTVGVDGSVSRVEVTESRGAALDGAAIAAASRFRFEPARRDGVPVAARIRAVVRFIAPPPPVRSRPTPEAQVTPRPPADDEAGGAFAPVRIAPLAAEAREAREATEVVVEGHTRPPSRGASDYTLPVGELSRVPRKNATELLELAPGVHLANEGGEGHAERVYLRGFDAREGQDIEATFGGVPVNESGNLHGNGFADLHFIIPELVLSLRVLEGPFDPRQGNYAVAGSVDFEPGLARRGLTAKYVRGSFGSERALVMFGPPGESVHTFGAAEIHRTDGFGENRDARRATVMAAYEGHLTEHTTFQLAGSAYANEYHSAGLLREDDVARGRKGFFDTYDARQGGGGTRFQVSTAIASAAGGFSLYQQLFAIRRTLRLRENLTGFLLDTQKAIQAPHGQRGDLFDLEMGETTIGGRGWARTDTTALGHRQELELGYFARGDSVDGTRVRVDAAGIPYAKDTDLHSTLADLGLYADVALRPARGILLRGGVRADLFAYDVLDACAVQDVSRPSAENPPGDASCLSQRRGGAYREPEQRSSTASTKLLPRASLLLGPFAHVSFSLAYGEGVRSIDPSYVTQDAATPYASVRAYDAGVLYARSFEALSVSARSVFFQTEVDRDLVFSETEGRSILGGGTTRTGWTGAVRLQNAWLDQNANVTLVRSAFEDGGALVPYVPDVVIRSDTAVTGVLPFEVGNRAPHASAGLGASFVGRRALPYGQSSTTIFTLDASAALGLSGYELGLEVTNLFDARYRQAEYDFVSDFRSADAPTLVPARHYVAGAPRMVFLSLSATFGGDT